MYCTRCGSPVTDDDRACPRCGGNLLLPGSVDVDAPTDPGAGGSRLGDTRIMPPVDAGPADPDSTRVNPRVVPGVPPAGPRGGPAELPDDWFRPGPSMVPPPPAAWDAAPRPPMLDPAPGQPPVATQRRYHERSSTSIVVALALVPVVLVAVLVWWFLDGSGSTTAGRPLIPASPAGTGTPTATQPPASPDASASPAASSAATSAASSGSSPTPSAQVPASATQCSAIVYAGKDTSCPFAENVAAALPSTTTDVFEVKAKSPVTHKEYTMTCTGGTLIDCRGGDNAEVFVIAG